MCQLTISQSSVHDSGQYTVKAKNTKGKVFETVTVDVSTLTTDEEDEVKLDVSLTLDDRSSESDISESVSGKEEPSNQDLVELRNIPQSDENVIKPFEANLSLVRPSDVLHKEAPPKFELSPDAQIIPEGDTIILKCRVSG